MKWDKLGKNQNDNKLRNRGLVLKMIATGQCAFRSDLVQSTGLSKMTVSNIVSELMKQGLLVERDPEANEETGRNPIRLEISPDGPKVVGLAILRNRIECVICDLNLHILECRSVPIDNITIETLIEIVFELLDTMLYMDTKFNIIAIGIASIGPINISKGMILAPFYFNDIKNIEIVRLVEGRYHLPVFFDHDNQSAAQAEKLYGCGQKFEDILFVGVGTGVGCGIVEKDRLHSNREGLSPELGHVSIDYKGEKCICGNRGCIERYINTSTMLEKMRKATEKFYPYQFYCVQCDNPAVDAIFKDAIDKLSVAIVSCINLLNSELVILGNRSVYWDDKYIALLERLINAKKFGDKEMHVYVRRAQFMENAQLLGAACNAISSIFEGRLLIDEL